MIPLPSTPDLCPGDLLVFSRRGLFDSIVKIKTWSQATHVEVFVGDGKVAASRNGQGVAKYALDLNGLYCVLRPLLPWNQWNAASAFLRNHYGRPYGWLALFSFCLLD